MSPVGPLRRRARRAEWRDPARRVLLLDQLARVEAAGGAGLADAAARVGEAALRERLEQHAADELRHAELFRQRAEALRAEHSLPPASASGDEAAPAELATGRPQSEVNVHGFYQTALLDELGDVAYVAMLHAAERRALKLYRSDQRLAGDDAETAAAFADVLSDEARHVAYTGELLQAWDAAGRGREVSAGRAAARGGRMWQGWKETGMRAGASFGRVVLAILYVTLLAPFGLAARRSRDPQGWQGESPAPTSGDAHDALRSQY